MSDDTPDQFEDMHFDSDTNLLSLSPIELGEDLVESTSVSEDDDFLIVQDPTDPDNQESWAVLILKGDYKDWVVRFPSVGFADGQLEFEYQFMNAGGSQNADEFELDELKFANYISSVLIEVLNSLDQTEGQVYVDTKTGEQIVDK